MRSWSSSRSLSFVFASDTLCVKWWPSAGVRINNRLASNNQLFIYYSLSKLSESCDSHGLLMIFINNKKVSRFVCFVCSVQIEIYSCLWERWLQIVEWSQIVQHWILDSNKGAKFTLLLLSRWVIILIVVSRWLAKSMAGSLAGWLAGRPVVSWSCYLITDSHINLLFFCGCHNRQQIDHDYHGRQWLSWCK